MALNRPNWVDYAKVFMIYMVVLGHYSYALDLEFRPSNVWSLMHIITLFHMPFFFVVSGFLFKAISVRDTIKKGWVQLLRPYVLMSLISCVIMVANALLNGKFSFLQCVTLGIGVLSGNDSLYSIANWSSALWFCYALFIIKIIISSLYQIGNKISCLRGAFLLMIPTLIVLYKGNIFPFRIDSSLVGLFFFCMVFFMKDIVKKMVSSKITIRIAYFLLAFLLLILSGYINLDFEIKQGLSINACYFGEHPLLFLVSGLCGTIAVLIMASFVSIKNRCIKNVVMQISNGTIIILGFHWVVYKLLFSWWLTSYNIVTALCVAFVDLIVCYIIILFANKYCPVLLGNRKLE